MNNKDNEDYDFNLDSSLINLDIVKRIGIEKSSNSIIVEVCNNIIKQVIYRNDFSEMTFKPLKKQIFDILSEYIDINDIQRVINSIITCINSNIKKILDNCNENNELALDKKPQIYFPYKYNPSAGNFRPFLTEEMENIIKELEIVSISHKISNEYQKDILITVIDCLIYYHYNSIDGRLLKKFFLEFNQKLCENPFDDEEIEYLWIEQTALIQTNSEKKNSTVNENHIIENKYSPFIEYSIDIKKQIHKNKKEETIFNKSNQKRHTFFTKPSNNTIEYEKTKGKLLSLCNFNPSIEQVVKYLKLMYDFLSEELGYLCKPEIIEKIVNDVAEIGLSKEQIQMLLLKEDI